MTWKRLFPLFFLAAAFVLPCLGQDVPLTVEGGDVHVVKVDQVVTVKVDRTVVTKFPFTIKAPADEGFYDWIVPPGIVGVDKVENYEVTSAPKGDQVIRVKIRSAQIVDGKVKYLTRFGSVAFSVGEPGPTPPPPVPPQPPQPKPDDPAPIPAQGLRVLVLYEIQNGRPGLTSKQSNEVYGEAFTKFCNDNCVKDANGTPEFRIYPKDVSLKNSSELWRQAVGKYAGAVTFSKPRLVVSDGVHGYEGDLPDGTALDVVKKYAK